MKEITYKIDQLPGRCSPIVCMDANAHVGVQNIGDTVLDVKWNQRSTRLNPVGLRLYVVIRFQFSGAQFVHMAWR